MDDKITMRIMPAVAVTSTIFMQDGEEREGVRMRIDFIVVLRWCFLFIVAIRFLLDRAVAEFRPVALRSYG